MQEHGHKREASALKMQATGSCRYGLVHMLLRLSLDRVTIVAPAGDQRALLLHNDIRTLVHVQECKHYIAVRPNLVCAISHRIHSSHEVV